MLIYDRLKIIGSLDNLRKKSIRKSIKYFFLKMWIDENGTDVLDYKSDITENVRDYVRGWMMKPPLSFKNTIKDMINKSIQYRTLGSEKSFLKFLSYQLDKAYLIKNIPFLQFNYSVADVDAIANEIHSEFVGSAGNTLLPLEENINIIIDSISNDEVLYVLTDVLLKRTIVDELFYVTKTAKTENKIEDFDFIGQNNNVVTSGFGSKNYFNYLLEGNWAKDPSSRLVTSSNGRLKIYTSNIKQFKEGFYICFSSKPSTTQSKTKPTIFSFPNKSNNDSLFTIEMTEVSTGVLKLKIVSSDPKINVSSVIDTYINIDQIADKKFKIIWDTSLKIYFNNNKIHEADVKWDVEHINKKYIILNADRNADYNTNTTVDGFIGNIDVGNMVYTADTPTLSSNSDYNTIYKNIIGNFISIPGLYNSKITEFSDLFTFIKETDIESVKVKIFNYISNTFYGMNLRYLETVFNYSSDLERDLTHYVIDTICDMTFDYSKVYYTNEAKYAELIGKFKEELLDDIFFKNINIGNESSTSLSPAFNLQRINEIYSRHSKSFVSEPEHFNNVLQNTKNIYLNIPILRKSNFNFIFIPEKLNSFFDEFCVYVLWIDWLSSSFDRSSAIPSDRNGLVPADKSTIEYVKPLINKCLKENFFTVEEFIPSRKEADRIFTKVSNFDKRQPLEIQKLNIVNNLKLRIQSFKYVRFTMNGMTEYEQYKLEFYKYITKLYINLNQDIINTAAKELNDFYDSL